MPKQITILKSGAEWIGLVKFAWRIHFNDYNGWEDSCLDTKIAKPEFMNRLSKCSILADPMRFGNWGLIKI